MIRIEQNKGISFLRRNNYCMGKACGVGGLDLISPLNYTEFFKYNKVDLNSISLIDSFHKNKEEIEKGENDKLY